MNNTAGKTLILLFVFCNNAAAFNQNRNLGMWINAKLPNCNISLLDKESVVGVSAGLTWCINNNLVKLNYSFISADEVEIFQDTPIEHFHDITAWYGYLFRLPINMRQSVTADLSCGIGWARGVVKGALVPATGWIKFADEYEPVELSEPVYKILVNVIYSPGRHFGVGPFFEYGFMKQRHGMTAGVAVNAGWYPVMEKSRNKN